MKKLNKREKSNIKSIKDILSPGNDKYKQDILLYQSIQKKGGSFEQAVECFKNKHQGKVYIHPIDGIIDESMMNQKHSSLIYLEDYLKEIINKKRT